MKKQYIVEPSYDRNVKITFYKDGKKVYSTIISEWEVDGYLLAKHEYGWEEAYSQEQYFENKHAIQKLLNELAWREEYLKEMEDKLITKD